MSYDVRILVKEQVTDRFIELYTPERDSPTYNLRNTFKESMGLDWKQGEAYPCAVMLPAIQRGIRELTCHAAKYDKLNPENGWGSRQSALECLREYEDAITQLTERGTVDGIFDEEPWPIEALYFMW